MKLSVCAVTITLILVLTGCASANVEGWDIPNPDGVDNTVATSLDDARSTILSSEDADGEAARAWVEDLKAMGFEVIADRSAGNVVSLDLRKGNTIASVRVGDGTVYVLSEITD